MSAKTPGIVNAWTAVCKGFAHGVSGRNTDRHGGRPLHGPNETGHARRPFLMDNGGGLHHTPVASGHPAGGAGR